LLKWVITCVEILSYVFQPTRGTHGLTLGSYESLMPKDMASPGLVLPNTSNRIDKADVELG
jgi:hypothetical protein